MMLHRKLTTVAIGTALALVPASPALAGADQLTSSWANVNVCSSSQLGARAQLAGDGTGADMRVRFTAQWLSPGGWVPLSGSASSPWQSAGSSDYTWGQAGWTFALNVPAGKTYQVRAVAELQWTGSGRASTQVTGSCSVSA